MHQATSVQVPTCTSVGTSPLRAHGCHCSAAVFRLSTPVNERCRLIGSCYEVSASRSILSLEHTRTHTLGDMRHNLRQGRVYVLQPKTLGESDAQHFTRTSHLRCPLALWHNSYCIDM